MAYTSERENVELCRGFTVKHWQELRPRLDSNSVSGWSCAIEVFDRRIRERFLSSIEILMQADSFADVSRLTDASDGCSSFPDDGYEALVVPGFAITALCCLLIETLQSFRAGGGSSNDQIRTFLLRPSFRGAFDREGVASKFVGGVRNGIFHEAETRGWSVRRAYPTGQIVMAEGDRFFLNRSELYYAVRAEFEQYLADLHEGVDDSLRERFLRKMDDLATRS